MGKIRPKHDRIDPHLVHHPTHVLLRERRHHKMPPENIGRPLSQPAVLRPLRLPTHQKGMIHLPQRIRQPHRPALRQTHPDIREPPKEVVQDQPRRQLQRRPVTPIHHPLERIEITKHRVRILRPVRPVLLIIRPPKCTVTNTWASLTIDQNRSYTGSAGDRPPHGLSAPPWA